MKHATESSDEDLLLIRKLEQFARLDATDRAALTRVAGDGNRVFANRDDILREGERPRVMSIILDGFACRYKTLEDGRRQIIGFLIPGDVCDPRLFIVREMDHSVAAIGAVRTAEVSEDALTGVIEASARLRAAFLWSTMVEEAVAREWIVNVGQRTAVERMAHLICELFFRLAAVGLVDADSIDIPLTQADLADALGLSAVHTNRTLQDLRAERLLVWKGKRLFVPNLAALQAVALHNPRYLHQTARPSSSSAESDVRPLARTGDDA